MLSVKYFQLCLEIFNMYFDIKMVLNNLINIKMIIRKITRNTVSN